MINYKISFLIVLISVVCFSADVDSESQTEKNIEKCKTALRNIFGRTDSPKKCAQYAIKDMKLYGDGADDLDNHVRKYYELFHEGIKLRKVLLPKAFFRKRKEVDNKELEIFKEVPNVDYQPRMIPTPGNYLLTELGSSEASSSGSSNDSMIKNDDSEVMIILKNALYYHVTYDPTKRKMPDDEEARKYVHVNGSYGYLYLLGISMSVVIDTDKFPTPSQFCIDLYSKSKRQKIVHKDGAGTSHNLD